jgi:transcription elongation GreA/GreB family factor
VSYRAAVGKALLGRKVGDKVMWNADGRDIGGTVESIKVRPPTP